MHNIFNCKKKEEKKRNEKERKKENVPRNNPTI